MYFVVPENRHIHPMDDHWKIQGVGVGGLESQTFKGMGEASN